MPMSNMVRSPEALSPNSLCCDRMCRVRVIRSVEGGSKSAVPGAGCVILADARTGYVIGELRRAGLGNPGLAKHQTRETETEC